MALQSQLLRGDPKLEACATHDPAHIVPGAAGEHVRKIQIALNSVDSALLNPNGLYDATTAAAVLSFKRKRNIVNRTYQTKADDIVGRMTILELDKELRSKEDQHGHLRILMRGMRGEDVRLLHAILNFHLPPPYDQLPVGGPEGLEFGPRTEDKVKEFQKINEIDVGTPAFMDGIVVRTLERCLNPVQNFSSGQGLTQSSSRSSNRRY
jgi:peptidoglycan hydrolase-like protein with peptidoglycan-binding domain